MAVCSEVVVVNGGIVGLAIANGVTSSHASYNGSTHVNNRPPLQFVLKQTLFGKLFLKQAPYSKFAHLRYQQSRWCR